jgi:hypothetical protein
MDLWAKLLARIQGPMSFRLIVQPLVACFIGAREGLKDAREGKPPYFLSLFHSAEQRRLLFREGWKHISKIYIIAVILDGVFQVIVFHRFRLVGALIIAAILAPLPYAIARGLANRFARRGRGAPGSP